MNLIILLVISVGVLWRFASRKVELCMHSALKKTILFKFGELFYRHRWPALARVLRMVPLLLLLTAADGAFANDTCKFAKDGECDEPLTCQPGTDTTDCRGAKGRLEAPAALPEIRPSAGPDSCVYAKDGQCDEPRVCTPGTDTTDCKNIMGGASAIGGSATQTGPIGMPGTGLRPPSDEDGFLANLERSF